MPTTHPRYILTDTGVLAQALDTGQESWPDTPRGPVLLAKMVISKAEDLTQSRLARQADRIAAVEALEVFAAGGRPYPAGYVNSLHEEWPA